MTESHAHDHATTNSHILVHEFDYCEPASLDEAVAILERQAGQAELLAGGTHLLVLMKMEREAPQMVVNITKIPGLNEIAVDPPSGALSIGACATIRDIYNHPLVRECYPALVDACASFGGAQVEIMGTLGGNICNGSPASDSVPALLVYAAELELVGPRGARRLPLEQFLLGPGQTDRRPAEILTRVILPAPEANSDSLFLKVTRVAADLAKANLAVLVVRDGERIASARVAMGSVAPTVLRLRQTEAALAGQPCDPATRARAGAIAAQEISPIDDTRSSAWYRRQLANVLLQDALTAVWQNFGRSRRPQAPAVPAHGSLPRPMSGALPRGERREIELHVNGRAARMWVRPNELLLNALRDHLGLTGAKYGCGVGECGACTVLLDGKPVMGCLTLAVAADGRQVATVEGLQGKDGHLDPLQQQFIDDAAFQCGYCTPGFLMATKGLLNEIPHPGEQDVRDYLKGNRCRCTGYVSIIRAILNYTKKNS